MTSLHVIFGTGPVGCWTARSLVDRGLPVRAVNRGGRRPDLLPAAVELVTADASDAAQAVHAVEGAGVVYQAMNPPYDRWHEAFPVLQASALAAAGAAGARYVSVENLYMYDSSAVMTEDSPQRPVSKKGELRLRMADEVAAAHARGVVQAAQLRSADYYGPRLGGSATQPHSFAYIEDVGRAAAELGVRDEAVGRVWFAPHAPALTQGAMADGLCRELGEPAGYSVISPLMMRLAGLFVPAAKESVEMLYEFTQPFVVDSGRIQREFSLDPTPSDEGLRRTAVWWRGRPAG